MDKIWKNAYDNAVPTIKLIGDIMSYPALKNLGINRPHEISGYTLTTENDNDVLRVRYMRQKGSLLPTSKRFKFPRRPMPGVHTLPGEPEMTEISPALEDALAELSSLLSDSKSEHDKKVELIRELDEFESFIRTQLAEFRAEIEKL